MKGAIAAPPRKSVANGMSLACATVLLAQQLG